MQVPFADFIADIVLVRQRSFRKLITKSHRSVLETGTRYHSFQYFLREKNRTSMGDYDLLVKVCLWAGLCTPAQRCG
jgi:hypothetical protein